MATVHGHVLLYEDSEATACTVEWPSQVLVSSSLVRKPPDPSLLSYGSERSRALKQYTISMGQCFCNVN